MCHIFNYRRTRQLANLSVGSGSILARLESYSNSLALRFHQEKSEPNEACKSNCDKKNGVRVSALKINPKMIKMNYFNC